MAKRTRIVIDRYTGYCPECGVVQDGRTDTHADRVCNNCRNKHATAAFIEKLAFLRGAEIIDFKGKCEVMSNGDLGACSILSMTVATHDRRIINVTTENGEWQAVEHDEGR